jgi:hypothetical protein
MYSEEEIRRRKRVAKAASRPKGTGRPAKNRKKTRRLQKKTKLTVV